MAKEKKELNPEQFNEFLVEVATKVEPRTIGDIFSGKAVKETYQDLTDDNPLIRSYKLTGTGFINKILRDKTDFKFSDEDKKLLLEVGAFGNYDPKSGFKLNDKDPKVAKLIEENAKKLAEARPNMSDAEYESYRANLRKDLVADVLKTNVTQLVFDDTAPKLDVSERDRTKPFSDFITKELQMQSGLGFEPEVPDFAGGTVGKKFIPASNQNRYFDNLYDAREFTSEAFPRQPSRVDRLKDFYPDEESGFLRGPEGIFYNPQTEQFLRQEDVYGPPPTLQGYQYDPRLKGILSEAINPDYGSQFKAGGKTMDIREQTKNVAAQGRYGDSMLLHVNPAEVKGLAQAMPITINPQTGQPEAFLPFLAPLLGSIAGGALFTGLSPAIAAGLGAGLATYAQTGGSGSKALLSGLTAGLGTGALNKVVNPTAAATTSAATDAASQLATTVPANLGIDATTQAATQLGTDAATQLASSVPASLGIDATTQAATQLGTDAATQAANRTFMEGLTGPNTIIGNTKQIFAGSFDEGVGNLGQALMTPSGFTAAGLAGAQGIMNSQELFEEMIARNAREAEEERQRIMAENPEMIPIATGGVTSFQEGGDTDIDITKLPGYDPADASRYRRAGSFDDYRNSLIGDQMQFVQDAANFYSVSPSDYYQGMDGNLYSNNPYPGVNLGSYTDTGYVRKREGLPIEQNFMAGFMPERGYFKGLNPSYTEITDTGETVKVDPLEEYNRTVIAPMTSRPFDPTKTAGYQSFYGQAAKDIIPQVVDPYAPVQFEQPQPLIAPPSIGGPRIPVEQRDTGDTIIADDSRINISEDIPEVDFGLDFSKAFTAIRGEPTPKATAVPSMPDQELMSIYGNEDIPVLDSSEEREDLTDLIAATRDMDMRAAGMQTDIEVDKLPEGLKKMYESGPKGREGVAKIAAKTDKFQEGGATEMMQDPLTVQLLQFLRGEIQDDTIVGRFVDKYGNEAFLQIREQVLQEIVPGAETTGQIVNGNNAGGMADNVYGKIGAEQGVAVSQDEYIIPADVMSMLGDGSSDAGAKKLDQMLDRVRMDKTGTTEQAAPINERKIMPA